jgi:hypothetical protein
VKSGRNTRGSGVQLPPVASFSWNENRSVDSSILSLATTFSNNLKSFAKRQSRSRSRLTNVECVLQVRRGDQQLTVTLQLVKRL